MGNSEWSGSKPNRIALGRGLFFASAGGFRCPHVADDAAEEQGDHAAPEGHMDAKLFAHDGQEEGASARAETADGNGQAYAGAAQFRWEHIFGCGSTFGVLSRGVAVVAFHFDLVKVGCSIQPPATIEY